VLVIDLFSGNFANASLYIFYRDMEVLYAIETSKINANVEIVEIACFTQISAAF
jgi:hypothetical protein